MQPLLSNPNPVYLPSVHVLHAYVTPRTLIAEVSYSEVELVK